MKRTKDKNSCNKIIFLDETVNKNEKKNKIKNTFWGVAEQMQNNESQSEIDVKSGGDGDGGGGGMEEANVDDEVWRD